MFDISFPELMVVAVVALLILGPDKLPVALRTLGLWLGRMRRSFLSIKTEVEREIGMDEVRRQLHNESIMHDLKRIEQEVRAPAAGLTRQLPVAAPAPSSEPAPSQPAPSQPATSQPATSGPTVSENGGVPEASRQG